MLCFVCLTSRCNGNDLTYKFHNLFKQIKTGISLTCAGIMALVAKRGLLNVSSICIQSKRFRGKINLRRPQQPHFERAKFLAVAKPIIVKPKPILPVCDKDIKLWTKEDVDNKLQKFFAQEVLEHFKTSKMIAFYHMNPMTAEQHYNAYVMFHKANMLYKNYGKKTLEMAVKGTPYETVLDFYICHNMLVFSPELNIKKLLRISKKFPQIVLLAGIIEGRLVSKDDLVKYSNIPDVQTARAELVQTIQSVGSNVVQQLNTHQQTLVSQLEERMKQLKVE